MDEKIMNAASQLAKEMEVGKEFILDAYQEYLIFQQVYSGFSLFFMIMMTIMFVIFAIKSYQNMKKYSYLSNENTDYSALCIASSLFAFFALIVDFCIIQHFLKITLSPKYFILERITLDIQRFV